MPQSKQKQKQYKAHTKIQKTKQRDQLISSCGWQRGIINYPQALPVGKTATYTQQCIRNPKNCKRKESPNPSHQNAVGSLTSCSQTFTHLNNKVSLRIQYAIYRDTERSKCGTLIVTTLQIFAFLNLSRTQNITGAASTI